MQYIVHYKKDGTKRTFHTHDADHARNMQTMMNGQVRDSKGQLVKGFRQPKPAATTTA